MVLFKRIQHVLGDHLRILIRNFSSSNLSMGGVGFLMTLTIPAQTTATGRGGLGTLF